MRHLKKFRASLWLSAALIKGGTGTRHGGCWTYYHEEWMCDCFRTDKLSRYMTDTKSMVSDYRPFVVSPPGSFDYWLIYPWLVRPLTDLPP